jgi:hypothetical protein
MELWKTQSKSDKQMAVSAGCTLAGLIIAIGFRNFASTGGNAMSGFLLGVLLLIIGVAGLLVTGKQTVTIDPKSRRITIEDSNRIKSKKRTIVFSDINEISIGYLGKKSNLVTCYYLVLKLRNGEEYPLFAPGRFYEGASDRSIVSSWKQRLEGYLGQ